MSATTAGASAEYSTRFQVRRGGHYAIRFASVNHYATVWLDGRKLGTSRRRLRPVRGARASSRPAPTHVLTVRADWRFPELQRKRGWNRAWFNFGGINRTVSLERIGYSQPAQPRIWTHVVRVPGGGRAALVSVEVRVRNNSTRRRIALSASLRRGGKAIGLRFGAATVPRGRTHLFQGTASVIDPDLWSPGSPALYDMRIEVPGESAVTTRVGLRELRWRSGRLYLNGRRLLLRGASLPPDARGHGDALTAADHARIVRELRAIGANATRAQQRTDPALLARLDAAGIMVWQEIGPFDAAGDWTSNTPLLQRRARQRAIDAFAELQPHPSIIAWSLANELAGQGHPGDSRSTYMRSPGSCTSSTPAGLSPSTSGDATARASPGPSTTGSTRSDSPTTTGGTNRRAYQAPRSASSPSGATATCARSSPTRCLW